MGKDMEPSYFKVTPEEFEKRIRKAWEFLNPCRVCPRKCGVNRTKEKPTPPGFCRMGVKPIISSYHAHFGEEPPLVGTHGSGTIFFSSCNLACVYCQNWEISQLRLGQEVEAEELAEMMIKLQNQGCHNINFVSPTIWVPQILKALWLAIEKGLSIPLVYNTGGYDSVETLKLLGGVIDIYMPDIKYSDSKIATKYSLVPNYWEVVQKAVKEMHRQVGDLLLADGITVRGLLIRHLVLPNDLAGTGKVMKFITKEISKNSYVNIMDQYYPSNKAFQFPEINRRITAEEYRQALNLAKKAGLSRLQRFA